MPLPPDDDDGTEPLEPTIEELVDNATDTFLPFAPDELPEIDVSSTSIDDLDQRSGPNVIAFRASAAARQAAWTDPRPQQQATPPLDFGKLIWNAGADIADIPPREWILGNLFCKGFVSSLLGDGAAGKTATRMAMAMAMSTGRGEIVGEHVFQRSRVLYLGFEDGKNEMRRRERAARIYHQIDPADIDDWLFLGTIPNGELKLGTQDRHGRFQRGALAEELLKYIKDKEFNVIIFDPFVKTHGVNENDNNAIDQVMEILTGLAINENLAIDAPHHTRKASGAEPGDADVGRGASAAKNAGRLVYTLTKMSAKEAELMGVSDSDRQFLVRHDSAKVNIAPPSTKTKWFRLVDVDIGNATELYPRGDHVQTVELWTTHDFWTDFSADQLNVILDDLDEGLPKASDDVQRYYSGHARAIDRLAWHIVQKHAPQLTDAQAQQVISTWIKNGVLHYVEYPYRSRTEKGLRVNPAKRPG